MRDDLKASFKAEAIAHKVRFYNKVMPGPSRKNDMHGEYKMPGGKLIVADVEVDDGRLSHVQISGDFFLEPDTALGSIDRALENLPADTSEDVLADAIDTALGPEVRMYGISAAAVAVAVRRALEPHS